ncbi:MAG: hypothetical protein ACI4PH_08130 [Faecousia sp.]
MKRRILSLLLAGVLLAGALPLGASAAENPEVGLKSRAPWLLQLTQVWQRNEHLSQFALLSVSGYAVSASEDVAVNVGETAVVRVAVSQAYHAYDLKITYDSDLLTCTNISAPDPDAGIKSGSGRIRVIGFGEEKTAQVPAVTLTFTAKAPGDARVRIASARVDTGSHAITDDAPAASITDDTTVISVHAAYAVELGEGLASDSLTAVGGEDYSFRATDPNNYDYAPTATVSGNPVTVTDNGDGTYTIPGTEITGPVKVEANRKAKSYRVTLKGDVSGKDTATYRNDYTFKIKKENGYSYSISVTIGGKTYTGYRVQGDAYTIPGTDITGEITVTVTKTRKDPAKVYVRFVGSGAGDASGPATTVKGVEYRFQLKQKADYRYEVYVEVNGKRVPYSCDETYCYIDGIYVTDDITITVIRTALVEVNEYITLDKTSMYLIVYNGAVESGETARYDGQSMYWSDAYGGFAWLVISGDSEKQVADQAARRITVGDGKAAAGVVYSGDVNLSGKSDVNDAQLAWDMYSARYTLGDMQMQKFLNADVNADRRVNVKDAAAIVRGLLEE